LRDYETAQRIMALAYHVPWTDRAKSYAEGYFSGDLVCFT